MCSVRKLILLLTVALAVLASTIASDVEPSFCKGSKGFCVVRRSTSSGPTSSGHSEEALQRRGLPARPGDIEVFGYWGSLLAIPTLLSVMGIVTNYNLEKSYFNSQINAQYYKQSREMLKAHAAQLIQEQESKFAKAGVTWQGMVYDKDGHANPGAKLPSSKGVVLLPPQQQLQPGQVQTSQAPQQVDSSAASNPAEWSPSTQDGRGSDGAEEPGESADPSKVNTTPGGSGDGGVSAAGGSPSAASVGDGAKSGSS